MPLPGACRRFPGVWCRLACLVAGVIVPGVVNAGQGEWTTGGPFGGNVNALVIDAVTPSTLYAGENENGVFKSIDSAGNWASLGGGQTFALAVDRTTPGTLYAGTVGSVGRSTDGGASWSYSDLGQPGVKVVSLAVDPVTPTTVYAGTDGGRGVFKSTDSGVTWFAAASGLPDYAFVKAVVIDPSNPATLYASAGPLYKSTDAGGSWAAASSGLPAVPVVQVLALAIDPTAPSTLYAGMGLLGGVFKSSDAGGSWEAVSTGLPAGNRSVQALTVDPRTHSTIYAGMAGGGVFRSVDSGGTWTACGTGLRSSPVNVVAVDPASPSTLYAGMAGSLGGVYRSTDSGASWKQVARGMVAPRVNVVAVSSETPGTVYAGTRFTGVFRSTDSGTSWVDVNVGLEALVSVDALAVHPGSPGTLYAAGFGGLFKSTNSGGTWASASSGIPGSMTVHVLAIDPRDPSRLYAGGFNNSYLPGANLPTGLFRSTNAGQTWSVASAGLPANEIIEAIAIDPVNSGTLYAGTSLRGTFKSTDAGGTWTAANSGMPSTTAIYSLVIDPSNPGTLYAAGREFYKSTDAGAHWSVVPGPPVGKLVIHPGATATLYASTGAGVARSTDSGASWIAVNSGLPSLSVSSLALDPSGRTILYAGFDGRGVWQAAPPLPAPSALLVPSSARAAGAGGAFYMTDLTVANAGALPATFVLKFLGNNGDGRDGRERSFPIAAGSSTTFADVLGSVFDLAADFGAIRVTSQSNSIRALAQTSTPGFGGTFGQSVPAARPEDLILAGAPRSIPAVREDASYRTNLILANATEASLGVDVRLFSPEGAELAAKSYPLPPLGMTQVTKVVRDLGVAVDVNGARLVLSTATTNGAFAAYASVIDNVTNDPRTLLPIGPIASARPSADTWLLPSSARASGAGDAFYTTDLTLAYTGDISARFTLKFLGNNGDGRTGPEATFDLGSRKSVTYTDVLDSVFHRTSDFGAIRVSSQYPGSDAVNLAVLAQTSTPGFGGTFGQSVPAATDADLIRSGSERSILAVREDDLFRTNLILANATGATLNVLVQLVGADGSQLSGKVYSLPPLGMTQVTRVVRDLGVAADVNGARLVLSTATTNGAFAAYASVIDNVTNDPRTLLPR